MPSAAQWMHTLFDEVHVNSSKVTFDTIRCSIRGEMLVTGVDIDNMRARIGRTRLQSYMNVTFNGESSGLFGKAFDAPDMTYALERMWSTIFSNEFKQYN